MGFLLFICKCHFVDFIFPSCVYFLLEEWSLNFLRIAFILLPILQLHFFMAIWANTCRCVRNLFYVKRITLFMAFLCEFNKAIFPKDYKHTLLFYFVKIIGLNLLFYIEFFEM